MCYKAKQENKKGAGGSKGISLADISKRTECLGVQLCLPLGYMGIGHLGYF